MSESRVWLITGTSSGLGRAMAIAAVEAGDRVIATARRPQALNELVEAYPGQVEACRLDVTDPGAAAPLVTEVLERYGRIDVLVNNAGHGHLGAVEQTPDSVLREMFELHVFGPAALVQAVLPGMRAHRSGAIVQMSSVGGHIAWPGFSTYSATKFALEGYSEALAAEVGPLGIRVLIVEPGGFRTNFCGDALEECDPMPDYQGTVLPTQRMMKAADGMQAGDPARAAAAILFALAADNPPLRLPLGDDAVDMTLAKLDALALEIRDWEPLARSTGFVQATAPSS